MNAPDEWALYLDPNSDPDERAEIRSDLDEGETSALDRVGAILADEALWGGPSAGLRDELLGRVRTQSDASGDDPSLAITPGSTDKPTRRRSGRRLGMVGGGLVAAAAAIAAVLFATRPADDPEVTTYELAATELTPDLVASVDVKPLPAGVAIVLHIEGLPPAEEGTYYAAWLMPAAAEAMADGDAPDEELGDRPMVGVGSFHWREGGVPVGLWSGVDTDRFPIFIVTVQEEDAPPIASDVVVMTGRLTDG